MKKKMIISGTFCVIMLVALFSTVQVFAGRGNGPIIYVTSQGLFYDSIVTADPLPPKGPFQVLDVGPMGLQTEFGPGDPEYVGGRWVEDIDGDGVLHYFSCPLLGPGRLLP
jgi:hypothetical protein